MVVFVMCDRKTVQTAIHALSSLTKKQTKTAKKNKSGTNLKTVKN